jgi:hypothetical protein
MLPSLDVQIAELVTSCVLKLLKVAVAVNCCVVPAATDGVTGVTIIEETTALVTVTSVLPLIEPERAAMVALPAATVFTNPLVSTVVMVESEELHVAVDKV